MMKTFIVFLLTSAVAFGSEVYMLNFQLYALHKKNQVVDLNSYKGKIVFLTFIKSDCPWCKKELKTFNTLLKPKDAKEIQVVVVALDDTESVEAETKGLKYPVLRASEKLLQSIGGVEMTPYTLIADKNGDFETKIVGYQTAEELEIIINKLKGKK